MRKLLVAATLLLGSHAADAGPYCGHGVSFAPADDTVLPVAPLIAQNTEDGYYDGKRGWKATGMSVTAKIDDKRVPITTKDIRTAEGVIRLIKINSKRTGKLQIWGKSSYDTSPIALASYTISKDAPTIDTPAVTIRHDQDRRLAPYHRVGELLVIDVPVPAVAFNLRWRSAHDEPWRVRPLEARFAWNKTTPAELHLGASMCGMLENVPMKLLEAGIEAELTVKLPDGRDVALELPQPLVIPPKPDDPISTSAFEK